MNYIFNQAFVVIQVLNDLVRLFFWLQHAQILLCASIEWMTKGPDCGEETRLLGSREGLPSSSSCMDELS